MCFTDASSLYVPYCPKNQRHPVEFMTTSCTIQHLKIFKGGSLFWKITTYKETCSVKQGSAVHCTCNVQRDVTMHQQRGDCRGPATTCKVRTGVNISRCKKMMNEEEINSAVLKKMSAFLNLLPLFSFDKEVIFATVHLDLLRVRTNFFFFFIILFFFIQNFFFPRRTKTK